MSDQQSSRRPGRGRRLAFGVVVALVAATALLVAADRWSREHLAVMARDPAAGWGSCSRCHGGEARPRPLTRRPPGPRSLELLPDGDLLVSAERDDSIYRLAPDSGRIKDRIDVGRRPHGLALLPGGQQVAVTLRDEDALAIVDLSSRAVVARIPVGIEPTGVAVEPREGLAVVANTSSNDVSVVSLARRVELVRLRAGREPYAVALTPDGRRALIASRLCNVHRGRTVPFSELTVVSLTRDGGRVTERRMLESLHLTEGMAITQDGELALIPAMATHNLVPTTRVRGGWLTADVVVAFELTPPHRALPLVIDDANDYHADPAELVISADGRRAYLASGGRDRVVTLDLERLRSLLTSHTDEQLARLGTVIGPGSTLVVERLRTRANPWGLALSADGRRLHVGERLADSVATFDTRTGRLLDRIELGWEVPVELEGERLFHQATAQDGQTSCRSCHPDGHLDGLTYDFDIDGVGESFLDNRSLRGLKGTSPYKWIGLNPSIPVQCGPRFVKVLGRGESFDDDELAAMAAYLESIPTVNGIRQAPDSPEVELGRRVFGRTMTNDGEIIPIRDRCPTCHPAPSFTSRTRSQVGTGAETDFTDVFDAAHLLDLRYGAPYLHDGRARTLMEVLTVHNPGDEHGRTSDLTRVQLNALVEYLRTL